MEQYRGNLATILKSMLEIPDEEMSKFLSKTYLIHMPAGEHFTKEGEPTDRIGYVARGVFRSYYTNDQNEEFIKAFIFENDYVGSYTALLNGWNAIVSLESLEPSDVLVLDFADYSHFLESHICWERLGRKVAEYLHLRSEEREKEFLLDSARERYTNFLKRHPEVENRLKQYQIASYLGVTPVSLSRIRREIKLEKVGAIV